MDLYIRGWYLSKGCDLAWLRSKDGWLEPLTNNAKDAPVLGTIPASSDTVESEMRQMKHSRKIHRKFPILDNYHSYVWNTLRITCNCAGTGRRLREFHMCIAIV
jgi:hypothetical protein